MLKIQKFPLKNPKIILKNSCSNLLEASADAISDRKGSVSWFVKDSFSKLFDSTESDWLEIVGIDKSDASRGLDDKIRPSCTFCGVSLFIKTSSYNSSFCTKFVFLFMVQALYYKEFRLIGNYFIQVSF